MPQVEYPKGTRRGLAQPIIRGAVERGLSGRATLGLLRDSDLGYRSQDFYQDFREWKGVKLNEVPLSIFSSDKLIPERYTNISPFKLTTKYQYMIRGTFLNTETGKTSEEIWSLATDKRKTKEEILEWTPTFITDSAEYTKDWSFESAEVFQAMKQRS